MEHSPGIEAIDAALERAGLEAVFACDFPQPSPLERVGVHAGDGHWLFVSYGLSELRDKRPDAEYAPAGALERDRSLSGWGFELTLRLARGPEDAEPPTWPMHLLRFLADYVHSTRNQFAPTHTMDLEASLDPTSPGAPVTAVAFQRDPVGPVEGPTGRLELLHVIGITGDELAATRSCSVEDLLELVLARCPVTDPRRGSILDEPEVRRLLGV